MENSTTKTFNDAFNCDLKNLTGLQMENYATNLQFYDTDIWQNEANFEKTKNSCNYSQSADVNDDNFEMHEIEYDDFFSQTQTNNEFLEYEDSETSVANNLNAEQVEDLMEKIQNVRRLWTQKQKSSLRIDEKPLSSSQSNAFTEQEQNSIIEYLIEMSNKN